MDHHDDDTNATRSVRRGHPFDRALLASLAAGFGVPLDDAQLDQFGIVAAEIVAWNERVNLTRITAPADIARLHFADSLAVLGGLEDDAWRHQNVSCIDIGSGAGLPGAALALVCPSWRVTLVDSVAKKTAFLDHLNELLPSLSLRVITARAEDLGQSSEHRGAYDLVVARAVAAMPILAEYALPLLRIGGRLIAWKGRDAPEEARRASTALKTLGGSCVAVLPYDLGGGAGARHVVVIEKTAATPDRFPRKAGMPSKRPLV